ncbi:MAG: hypothetical protein NWQ95_03980, partial [Verrucomicrobiales bacterium]|nr:hypothetical protein [Verrucomicrobiales bacterium]
IKIASLRRVLVCLGEESDGKRILKDLFNLPRGDLFEVKMAVNPVKVHDRVERGSLMKKVRRRIQARRVHGGNQFTKVRNSSALPE